nr:hypothetical protein [uncultured Fluviicola sp.]
MRSQSFRELISAYKEIARDMDQSDLNERTNFLEELPFSLIIEGEYSEFENLEKWILQYLPQINYERIYYGKTDYDFGFVEYFLSDENSLQLLEQAVPLIFTTYPLALIPHTILRSDGCGIDIRYDPSMTDAIVY